MQEVLFGEGPMEHVTEGRFASCSRGKSIKKWINQLIDLDWDTINIQIRMQV